MDLAVAVVDGSQHVVHGCLAPGEALSRSVTDMTPFPNTCRRVRMHTCIGVTATASVDRDQLVWQAEGDLSNHKHRDRALDHSAYLYTVYSAHLSILLYGGAKHNWATGLLGFKKTLRSPTRRFMRDWD